MADFKTFLVRGPELSTSPDIGFGTVLPDGVEYTARLRWLHYEGFWILTWSDVAGVPIIDGIRVVANFNLLFPYSDPRLPDGNLICHDTTNKRQQPGRHDWRERHLLIFVPRLAAVPVDVVSATVIVPAGGGLGA